MMNFLKYSSLKTIRKKFLILYLLNIMDIILTLLLLNTGFFVEANKFMLEIVQEPLLCFSIKVIIPGLLLHYIFRRIKKATDKQLRYSNYIINSAIFVYFLINSTHILWICLIPIFRTI